MIKIKREIVRKNLYPEQVLNRLIHRYISKTVQGNGTRPSTSNEPREWPQKMGKGRSQSAGQTH